MPVSPGQALILCRAWDLTFLIAEDFDSIEKVRHYRLGR
jgi:hypothetical protein